MPHSKAAAMHSQPAFVLQVLQNEVIIEEGEITAEALKCYWNMKAERGG